MANVANIEAPLGTGGPLGLIGGALISGSGILAQRAGYRSPEASMRAPESETPVEAAAPASTLPSEHRRS